MKQIAGYIKEYFYAVNLKIFMLVSIFTAVLIFINYYFKIDASITSNYSFSLSFFLRYLIFLTAFAVPYLLYIFLTSKKKTDPAFIFLIFLAPAIFAFKSTINISSLFSDSIKYYLYWPVLFVITLIILLFLWQIFDKDQPFYGVKFKGVDYRPYLLMLLIMIPLIAVASTQPDFLTMYPKMKAIGNNTSWFQKLLFELSYGTDFITVELFFRGFLILAFIKWAGKDAILPMACFYCTIHFGKPLAECISSYFGGILLGIVVYNTRSIIGGLLVHLGIAWMMEWGGYLGNHFFR